MKSEEILAIDVGSELRSLCESQLRGTWQIPAELVRLALRNGASNIRVNRRGCGFVVAWRGGCFECRVFEDIRIALDRQEGVEERQRAVAAVERAQMQPLLWAAGLRGSRLRVAVADRGSELLFAHRDGACPRLKRRALPGGGETVSIRWSCSRLDRRRAVKWLSTAVRFAEAEVVVDGAAAPRGFEGGLFHVRLAEPVPVRLGLNRDGDEPVLWLLEDGVISARAGIPGYPPFEAAVELSGLVDAGSSAADLRRAVTPYVSVLVDRAVWMMAEVADRIPTMTEDVGKRITLLLLEAARLGLGREGILDLPLVKTAGDGCLLSVREVRELASRRSGLVPTVDRDGPLSDRLMDPDRTIVASAEVRAILAEIAGLRFRTAAVRPQSQLDRAATWFREWIRSLQQRVNGFIAGRRVGDGETTPAQKRLLEVLRDALVPTRVEFCGGRGEPRRSAGTLLIPIENVVIDAAQRYAGEEPGKIYPVLIALGLADDAPRGVRDRWRQTLER